MDNSSNKPLAFHGDAGGFFVAYLVLVLLMCIPLVGWAFGINYFSKWVAENGEVNGRKVTFNATLGETLVFVLVQGLLIAVTFGIYMFWYGPKMYKFMADHVVYADGVAAPAQQPQAMPTQPAAPLPPAMPPSPIA